MRTDRVIAVTRLTDLAVCHVPSEIMEPGWKKDRMDYMMHRD